MIAYRVVAHAVPSGRVSYALPAWGLTLSAGGALRFDPGAPGRGLALKVAPTWGVAGGGAAAPRRAPRRRRPTHPGPRRIAALVSRPPRRWPAGWGVSGPKTTARGRRMGTGFLMVFGVTE